MSSQFQVVVKQLIMLRSWRRTRGTSCPYVFFFRPLQIRPIWPLTHCLRGRCIFRFIFFSIFLSSLFFTYSHSLFFCVINDCQNSIARTRVCVRINYRWKQYGPQNRNKGRNRGKKTCHKCIWNIVCTHVDTQYIL